MKKQFLSILSILIAAALISGCASIPGSNSTTVTRKLNVTGTGTVELEPDIARVNIGVRSQSSDVADALEDNSAIAEDIIQSLLDMGIEENDIQTRNFNIYPQRDNRPGPEGEVQESETFVVENTVSVVVRNLDSLGEVLSTVVSEGANSINGVSFDIEDRESAIEEARQLAIEDAQAQAEAIAEAAGVELGAIQSIEISRNGAPAPRFEEAMDMGAGGNVPISGGTLTIRTTAHLTYAIK